MKLQHKVVCAEYVPLFIILQFMDQSSVSAIVLRLKSGSVVWSCLQNVFYKCWLPAIVQKNNSKITAPASSDNNILAASATTDNKDNNNT